MAVNLREQVLVGIRSGLLVDAKRKLEFGETKLLTDVDKVTSNVWSEIMNNPQTSAAVEMLKITESDIRDIVKSVAKELNLL